MTSGTLHTEEGRPALRFERLAHPIERVWRAVSEPAQLSRWFVAPVPWRPAAGEAFEALGQPGRIVELEAPRVLAWTWGEERYRFELRPDGDGCVLVFTHAFDERPDLTLQDGPVLRLERRYGYPVERVWRALTDPGELREWFPPDEPMTVTASEPSRLRAATWFGDALRFEMRRDGDGCVLDFTHAFADRDTAARSAAGWDRCFARLDALLAGQPMGEAASLETWRDVHERYAQVFGVDPEVGRRAYAEHPLT